MAERVVRRWVRRGLPWAFGLADQGLWSLTTFVLTVAAARSSGPRGLGAVSLGFAATLLAMGLERAFVLDPFLASGRRVERVQGARAVLTLSALWGVVGGVASAVVGAGLGGTTGAGVCAFAPFVPVVLIQDALRAVAYREGRALDAALARASWLATTLALILGGASGSVAVVVAAWGLGAVPAVILLASRLRYLPAPPAVAVGLWRRELRALGGPLGAASVIDGAGGQLEIFVAAGVAGAAALGGFRAAVSAFAPLTVLRPALGQVGLPRVAAAMDDDPRAAARRAVVLSGVLLAASLVYAAGAAVYGRLLPTVFGGGFARYSSLLLPLTVFQALSALGTGVHLYLLAAGRGRVMFAGTVVAVPLRLGATALLGARFGAQGLAWAVALAAVASLVVGLVGVGSEAPRWSGRGGPETAPAVRSETPDGSRR